MISKMDMVQNGARLAMGDHRAAVFTPRTKPAQADRIRHVFPVFAAILAAGAVAALLLFQV